MFGLVGLDRNVGTLTFSNGKGAFTMLVESVSDSVFETPAATVRRTSLAEFLNRDEEK